MKGGGGLCTIEIHDESADRALAPLLFDDDGLREHRKTRDPVAVATSSAPAKEKKSARRTQDSLPVHSFNTLLAELATGCRVKTRLKADPHGPPLSQLTQPNPLQKQALQLLGLRYPVSGNPE